MGAVCYSGLVLFQGVVFGVLGLLIGSFLNVLVLRQGTGRGLSGRSSCMSCGCRLIWSDLIPVFSWLVLRGRCRECGSRVSIQYPLVEATTGILFALFGPAVVLAFHLPFPTCVLLILDYVAIISILIAIAAYDILHTIIPDVWAYLFAVLAFLSQFLTALPGYSNVLVLLAAGPLAALPLYVLWLVSKGRWMGLGDAKLALGIGWLLGPVLGLASIMFAFIVGAVVSVFVLMPLSRIGRLYAYLGITRLSADTSSLTMRSEVAFGPFLIASCLIMWFFQLYDISAPFGFFGL